MTLGLLAIAVGLIIECVFDPTLKVIIFGASASGGAGAAAFAAAGGAGAFAGGGGGSAAFAGVAAAAAAAEQTSFVETFSGFILCIVGLMLVIMSTMSRPR